MFRVLTCLTGEHDWRLVVIAGLVCFLASVVAVSLFHRACATRGRARATWLACAGAATGCGIWATHFIAMLAYDPGVVTGYDVALTGLSLVAAVVVTFVGLSVAVRLPARWGAPVGGGIVGGGVACMHYIGMWALELPGRVTWSLDLVLVSIVVGIVFGTAALAVAVRRDNLSGIFLAALLLTLAIVSHHFTAMGAVEIVPDPTRVIATSSLSPSALALAIAATAVAVLGMSLMGAIADRSIALVNEELDQLNRNLEQLVEERTAELRAVRALLEATLENINQGVMMVDADRRVPVYNRRAIELLELPSELMVSRPSFDDVLEFLSRRGEFLGIEEQSRAEHIVDAHQSFQRRRPNGVVLQILSVPLSGGGAVRTFTDVTELLKKERLSTLGQLTATVAHELRNPLSAIRNTLPVMREMTAGKGVELDRPMSRIERSIVRCDHLVSGLLEYTRPCVLSFDPMYLDAWLGEVLDEQRIPDGIVLERDFCAPDCVVNIDAERFRRVIINLIDNAAQAIEHDQATKPTRKITVATRASDQVEIVVKDTGAGIAPDVLPKIFEPLFSTKNFGTGLGLPTVKQLVEQHGGAITIDSELGRGATVSVVLPLFSQKKVAA